MDLDAAFSISGNNYPHTTVMHGHTEMNGHSKKKKKKKKRRCKSNVTKEHGEASTAIEDGHMEGDPAFREFLRQSAQFRMERGHLLFSCEFIVTPNSAAYIN